MSQDPFAFAEESAEISGRTMRLACAVGRDMMPGVFPDRRLSVVFRLEAEDGGAPSGEWSIDEAWFRAGERTASAKVRRFDGGYEWDFITREGPDWDDRVVDLVARVTDERGGEHYLFAGGVQVGYCW